MKPRFELEERERRRIRRLIAPHMSVLMDYDGTQSITAIVRAIDAATRAPKKGKR